MKKLKRREFVMKAKDVAIKLALAQLSVYVVGTATKNLDGSMVAGAK